MRIIHRIRYCRVGPNHGVSICLLPEYDSLMIFNSKSSLMTESLSSTIDPRNIQGVSITRDTSTSDIRSNTNSYEMHEL